MHPEYDDDRLRKLYKGLLTRRAGSGTEPAIAVEVIQALAEGTYEGDDRAEQLDAVLRDPRANAEFQFFLDVARQRPRNAPRMQTWLAAAASVLILLSATLVWRVMQPPSPDPARSTSVDFLLAPVAGATVSPNTAFVWKRVPESESYRFELIDEQGNVVHEASTRDTSLILPATTEPGSATTFRWWVTARLRAGTDDTSPARAVRFSR